jgi:hypothetical protein
VSHSDLTLGFSHTSSCDNHSGLIYDDLTASLAPRADSRFDLNQGHFAGLLLQEGSRRERVPDHLPTEAALIGKRSTMLQGHWHFQCPECFTGDFELGYRADDQQFFCEVCLEVGGRMIRLDRRPTEEMASDYARSHPGLAA